MMQVLWLAVATVRSSKSLGGLMLGDVRLQHGELHLAVGTRLMAG